SSCSGVMISYLRWMTVGVLRAQAVGHVEPPGGMPPVRPDAPTVWASGHGLGRAFLVAALRHAGGGVHRTKLSRIIGHSAVLLAQRGVDHTEALRQVAIGHLSQRGRVLGTGRDQGQQDFLWVHSETP